MDDCDVRAHQCWEFKETHFDRRREDQWDLGGILEGRVIRMLAEIGHSAGVTLLLAIRLGAYWNHRLPYCQPFPSLRETK